LRFIITTIKKNKHTSHQLFGLCTKIGSVSAKQAACVGDRTFGVYMINEDVVDKRTKIALPKSEDLFPVLYKHKTAADMIDELNAEVRRLGDIGMRESTTLQTDNQKLRDRINKLEKVRQAR